MYSTKDLKEELQRIIQSEANLSKQASANSSGLTDENVLGGKRNVIRGAGDPHKKTPNGIATELDAKSLEENDAVKNNVKKDISKAYSIDKTVKMANRIIRTVSEKRKKEELSKQAGRDYFRSLIQKEASFVQQSKVQQAYATGALSAQRELEALVNESQEEQIKTAYFDGANAAKIELESLVKEAADTTQVQTLLDEYVAKDIISQAAEQNIIDRLVAAPNLTPENILAAVADIPNGEVVAQALIKALNGTSVPNEQPQPKQPAVVPTMPYSQSNDGLEIAAALKNNPSSLGSIIEKQLNRRFN
jgi:hypothetical protein